MSPTLEHGDFVVALGSSVARRCQPGDIVLVAHATLGLIVKRVARVNGDGVELEGDNAASCSRESLGFVPEHAILGRALLRIAPRARGTSWFFKRRGSAECERSPTGRARRAPHHAQRRRREPGSD
jgi:hypothetical protein